MSRIDPSIPLSVKPFQFEGFGPSYARAVSLRDMAQQRRLRGIQMQGAEIDIQNKQQEQSALQQAQELDKLWKQTIIANTKFEDGEPKYDDAAIKQTFIQSGQPELAAKWDETASQREESLLKGLQARQSTQKIETEGLLKEAESVKKSKSQPAYAKLTAKIRKRDPDVQLPPAFDENTLDMIISDANVFLTSEKDRTTLKTEKLDLEKKEREAAESKLTPQEQFDKKAKEFGYADYASAPKIEQDLIRGKVAGITIPEKTQTAAQLAFDSEVDDAMTAMGDTFKNRAEAVTFVRKRRFRTEQTQLENAKELLEERRLANKEKKLGTIDRATANNILTAARGLASEIFDSDELGTIPEEYKHLTGKSQLEIEDWVIKDTYKDLGLTRDIVMKAIAGQAPTPKGDAASVSYSETRQVGNEQWGKRKDNGLWEQIKK